MDEAGGPAEYGTDTPEETQSDDSGERVADDSDGDDSDSGVPCVRVEREAGEQTRKRLAAADLLDRSHDITHEAGHLYLPVTDPAAARREGYEVVAHDAPRRETQTTPADLLDFDPSYERIGETVVVDEDDPERARELADALVASDIPVETVLNRASKVQGPERVREWDLLVGEGTELVHREYGCEFALDLAAVYFSPRLATERHRVAEQVAAGEQAFDMFAGVGPFAVPFADRAVTVVATDINETAIEYLRENARRNGVADSVTAIHGDVREVAADYADWADRVVMNLPHSADEFLDSAVTIAGGDCLFHYYDIQHEDDPYGPGERAIRAAAEPEYDVTVETRRTVRSYAPHELNVCLDVRLRRQE
jgi:tRNA (guanine37-N1)-methyltransferase